MALADGFTYPVGSRSYIDSGGRITKGRPGGVTFPDNGIAPNGEPYGYVADDTTTDGGWYSATDHGEYAPYISSSSYHLGEDWNRGSGNDDLFEPVYAIANGTVVRMGDEDVGLYGDAFGNYVVLRHDLVDGRTVYSFYAHLDSIDSSIYTTQRGDIIGAVVNKDQKIGEIGNSGDAIYAHLHFEMYQGVISTTEEILDELGYSSFARPSGWVDPTDFIESNRDLGTTPPPSSGTPDLVAQNVSISDSSLSVGDTVSVAYEIANIGTGTASDTIAGIYLSTNPAISTSDTRIGTQTSAISDNPGDVDAETETVTLPSNLAAGTYYIGVIADYNNAQNESDESNNSSSDSSNDTAGVPVTIQSSTPPPASEPDLVAQNVSVSGSSLSAGDTVSVAYEILNQGGVQAQNTEAGIYLFADSSVTINDILIDFQPTTSLAPGAAQALSKVVTLPEGLNSGSYFLAVIADDINWQAESDETNNASVPIEITISDPAASVPDIAVQNVLLSTTFLQPGDTFGVAWDVVNVGSGDANQSGQTLVTQRWSWKFDQFAAVLSYSIGFISGGNLQVRRSSIIGLVRCHDPM